MGVAENGLVLDGMPLQVLRGPGDDPMNSVVYEPYSRTASTGDHDDFDGWNALVKRVQALDPSRVVVGHAGPAVRRGDRVLAEQIAWLETIATRSAPTQASSTSSR